MWTKIKRLFNKAETASPTNGNYAHFDEYEDDEFFDSSFSDEIREKYEIELVKAFKDMESGAKYMQFGHRKIGFKMSWDEQGKRGSLLLMDLKYPAPPGEDVKLDQFPESPSVVLNFSGLAGIDVLMGQLEDLKARMTESQYDYIENELTEDEII